MDRSRQSIISFEALRSNIKRAHLTPEQVQKDNPETRKAMQYKLEHFNGVDVYVPSSAKLAMSSYISMLKNKAAKIDQLIHLFSQQTYVLKCQSLRCIAAFAMHNTGGLDAGTCLLRPGL